ncbi:MAG: aminoacetone oxidase family FAD-binding enzyme [Betaproteobacteria bacterium HGW-Betaproteobacteria-11]|nr:MAG: aminoacetone oxidase family FAD-binding enzyme [Betaproteobacteria bacterium HGW-Betaproteobacteria-11]
MVGADPAPLDIAIIGGGPAGLMAAEAASHSGRRVAVFDVMPSVGRKFLLAGRGGLNLTHAEPFDAFIRRYGERSEIVGRWLAVFGPSQVREWAQELGIATFVGSSGRVFPREMKAAPLLRAWLSRLRARGIAFHPRHRWCGWEIAATAAHRLRFTTPAGAGEYSATAVILALGGGSWARLGSDGRWMALLAAKGIPLQPLRPANCGFDVAWSPYWREHLAARHAGQPVKTMSARLVRADGGSFEQRGEFVLTANGIEGSLIYALSAPLRDAIATDGHAELLLDLLPDRPLDGLRRQLSRSPGRDSWTTWLRRSVGLGSVKTALLRELTDPSQRRNPDLLAAAIKALPLRLVATRPLDEAISSAGGVDFTALDADLMFKDWPGIFCAGEMLDWEAPTGGYLLTACLASGRVAGNGAVRWLRRLREEHR